MDIMAGGPECFEWPSRGTVVRGGGEKKHSYQSFTYMNLLICLQMQVQPDFKHLSLCLTQVIIYNKCSFMKTKKACFLFACFCLKKKRKKKKEKKLDPWTKQTKSWEKPNPQFGTWKTMSSKLTPHGDRRGKNPVVLTTTRVLVIFLQDGGWGKA